MAEFAILESPKLISRKIWGIENYEIRQLFVYILTTEGKGQENYCWSSFLAWLNWFEHWAPKKVSLQLSATLPLVEWVVEKLGASSKNLSVWQKCPTLSPDVHHSVFLATKFIMVTKFIYVTEKNKNVPL